MASNSYGTVSNDVRIPNGSADASHQERTALLGGKTEGTGVGKRLRTHMMANVSNKWGDIALLFCYIITGLLDSTSVFVWGSFLSMQTGNTIYLGLGLAAPNDSTRWIRSGVSILAFCAGAYFFARYHRYFGGRKRWVLVSSYAIQLFMIIIAAFMVTFGPPTGTSGPVTHWIAVPIALVAFQSAGQAVTSRVLQFNTLTGVVLTSIYCDLMMDARLFSPLNSNVERNRRVAAPVLLLIGACFGGLWAHSDFGLAGALWSAVGLKVIVIIAWSNWTTEDED